MVAGLSINTVVRQCAASLALIRANNVIALQ